MTTLRNVYIIFMPLLLMSVIVDALYEVPKKINGNKQIPQGPRDDKNGFNQGSTGFNTNGPYSPQMSEDDFYETKDAFKKRTYGTPPPIKNNNDNSFQQENANRFGQTHIPEVGGQDKNQGKGNYVPFQGEPKKGMVPIITYQHTNDGHNPIVSDNSFKTTQSQRNEFQRNFQGLVRDFRSVENSSEFDKFLNTIVNLYKKYLISKHDMPSKGSIQMDINFENSYNTDEEVCNIYNLSFQKIYLNNHGFINGNIAGFLNLVGNSSRLELRSNPDYLKQKEELKTKYQHCVKRANTLNEMKTYNFIKNYNVENTEDKYDNVCSNFGKEENKPTCSDDPPLPRCTTKDMDDIDQDDVIDNNGRRNVLNNSYNRQSQFVGNGQAQTPVIRNDTDFYTFRLETGDIKIKKNVTNAVFNYINWPGKDNTFFSINVKDTYITGITSLENFLKGCRNIGDNTYNESDIKKMITKAGTRVKNANTQTRGSPVGNPASYTLAQPKNKKGTANIFDLKLALENLTFAYEESILKNDMNSCRLNKYVLSEAMKMSGEPSFVLSLMLLFVISIMVLF